MRSINFNIRMDESLKEQSFPIIESYGLTPAQAVKLFLRQIADTQTIPLSFSHKAGHIPNHLTEQAIKEARFEAVKAKQYGSIDEVIGAIQRVAEE